MVLGAEQEQKESSTANETAPIAETRRTDEKVIALFRHLVASSKLVERRGDIPLVRFSVLVKPILRYIL